MKNLIKRIVPNDVSADEIEIKMPSPMTPDEIIKTYYVLTYYGKTNRYHQPFWKKIINFALYPFRMEIVSLFKDDPSVITGYEIRKIF